MGIEYLRVNCPCKECSQRANMDNCPQPCEDYEEYLVTIGEKLDSNSIDLSEVREELYKD